MATRQPDRSQPPSKPPADQSPASSKDDAPEERSVSSGGRPAEPAGTAGEGDDANRTAHEILGKAHALLFAALADDVVRRWCPADLVEPVLASAPDLWLAFGRAQQAVATGEYDEQLAASGLSAKLAAPKRTGFAKAVRRFLAELRTVGSTKLGDQLRRAVTWARIPIGSMSFIPGVEVIGEGLDVVQAALGESLPGDETDERLKW